MHRPASIVLLSCALGIAGVLVAPANAQGSSPNPPAAPPGSKTPSDGQQMGHHHSGSFGLIRQVLTADQTDKFDKLVEQEREDSKPLFQQLHALQAQETSGKADDPQLQQKKAAVIAQLRAQHKANHEKIMGMLSDEQKSKLSALRAQQGGPSERSGRPPARSGEGKSQPDGNRSAD